MNEIIATPVIKTNRLTIRMVDLTDADAYYKFCSNPNVTKYLTFNPYHLKLQSKKAITNMIRSYLQGENVNFSIILNKTNEVIGSFSVGFNTDNSGQIGYILDEPYWNLKIMSEVLNSMIEILFNTYHLTSLKASYIKENVASEKLLLANNFKIDKVIKNGFKKNDICYDLVKVILYKN